MPSPFYPRRPGCALRVLPAVWAALSLGLPALAEAGQTINITENVSHDVFGNGDPDDNGKDKRPTLSFAAPSSNTITVSNGMVTGIAYGGYSGDSTAATGNSVTVSGGTVSGGLYGGFSANSGAAMGNSVTVSGSGSSVTGSVYGGLSDSGSVTNNSMTVSGSGSVTGHVYGGWSGYGVATCNSATISGSGSVTGDVYGGWSAFGAVTHNSVTVSGSGSSVTGDVYGGFSGTAAATNNSVTISGGSVSGDVAGGYSSQGGATGNSVIISGGRVGGNVYGGYSSQGGATGNTVTLSGGSVGGSVYGSRDGTAGFAGNTLNVTASGLTVGGLGNFQDLNFYLPSALLRGGTMLTVTGTADLTDVESRSSTVNVGIAGSSSHLAVGDKVTLIKAGTLITAPGLNSTANGTGMQGVTLAYTFDLDTTTTANALTATVTSGGSRDESKALSEGVLASAALVNRGGDMAAGEAMAQAMSAGSGGGFGAMSGGSMRYNSGSHSDVSSISLATGFAKGFELDQGQAVLGAFLEYGNGSYDAYNSFATGKSHGSGDLDYVGVGMLGRMDFAPEGPGHAYTEASLRLGRTHNKYDNADLGGGIGAHYKTSPAYYGGHIGAGYVWDIAPKTALDLSAKYLVTHQNA
ncbi:MAG: hypothetical protein VB101_11425, partial [Rhodospirillaceae bacterium]|nr:hypothetical protein [Rhodospirillaceae bacterium]